MISNAALAAWIQRIAAIPGIEMDPNALVDDVVLMAMAFPEEKRWHTAMIHVEEALVFIVQRRDIGQNLRDHLSGWKSYHFQSQHTRKHPADLRIVYQDTGQTIRVRGFGHRWLPDNVYQRLYPR
ncbi:hypothetical protein [Sulfobacillus thermosulfidooxidans]|uniref:hypothetical protein n=1 Tax=Sulfobacillus thermosulfidooxidans TaxID=28034 RepID=UPI0006B400FA|nr:hypothetical protein [Sulfobacillus thermosulfidooxidans]